MRRSRVPHTFFTWISRRKERQGFLKSLFKLRWSRSFFSSKENYLQILSHDINSCQDVSPLFLGGFIFILWRLSSSLISFNTGQCKYYHTKKFNLCLCFIFNYFNALFNCQFSVWVSEYCWIMFWRMGWKRSKVLPYGAFEGKKFIWSTYKKKEALLLPDRRRRWRGEAVAL